MTAEAATAPSVTPLSRWLPAATLVLAAALFLPGLGSGLWEPSEVAAVQAAREPGGAHPPLAYVLQAAGLRIFGGSELAARLPVALAALGCLALAWWIGKAALGRRAAVLGVFVLATSPAFLFEARQATSEVLASTAALAAWGSVLLIGHVRWLWVVLIGAAGLIVGTLAGGVLLGAAMPLVASAGTLAIAGPRHRAGKIATAAAGALALLACIAVGIAMSRRGWGGIWLGGTVRKIGIPASFDSALKTLAHGAFPWSAFVPLALLHAFSSGTRTPAIVRTLLLSVMSVGFGVALISSWWIDEIRYPGLVACALAIGVYLDDAIDGRAGGPFAALLAACGAAILGRDLFLSPGALLQAQHLDGLKHPVEVRVQFVHLGVGLVFAVVAWVGLGWWRKAIVGVALVALPYAAFASHWWMSELGTHFSSKGLLDAYRSFAREGEPLAQYHVAKRAHPLEKGADIRSLRSQPQFLEYLRETKRVFALVPPSDLAPLDQASRRANLRYYVLDDSSSRALLLSNRLLPEEEDRNPLRRFVFREPTKPKQKFAANFENKVKLIGFDMPESAELGGKFRVALHFHVIDKLPPNWKLFMHFDKPAYRIHGDHPPVGGKLPTQYWSVGDYIIDEHEVEVPRMTTPRGVYTAYVGFWLRGDLRLKVVEGPNDGADRVKLGTLRVK